MLAASHSGELKKITGRTYRTQRMPSASLTLSLSLSLPPSLSLSLSLSRARACRPDLISTNRTMRCCAQCITLLYPVPLRRYDYWMKIVRSNCIPSLNFVKFWHSLSLCEVLPRRQLSRRADLPLRRTDRRISQALRKRDRCGATFLY